MVLTRHDKWTEAPLAKKTIRSDSEYMVKGVNEWSRRWELNGYLTANGQPVVNGELFRQLNLARDSLERSGIKVDFQHVPREENRDADRWANLAFDKYHNNRYQPESYINDEEDFEGPHTSPEAFIELIDAQGFHGDDFYNDCQDAYSLGEITGDFYSDSYGCSYRDSSDCITMMITMMIAMTIATTIVTMVTTMITTMIPTMITDIDGTEYGHNGIQTICVRTLAPKSHHTPTMLNNFRSDVYSEIVAKDNKH
ncbi:hypothetical protein TMEN_8825 [Trichophyton mentagrophytes]|nr:hypothetical protein TMEN_8825 [Trichophyton mentagrophytes]